jgi:hypothetical protein
VLPLSRAIADRFIYDNATLFAVAASLDAGMAEEGLCEATGWTVRQTLGHLGYSQAGYAVALEQVLAGVPVTRPSGRLNQQEQAGQYAGADVQRLITELRAGRDRVLAALAALSAVQAAAPFAAHTGTMTVADVASRHFATHMREHGVDLLEARPALVEDPVVLDWALEPAFAEGRPAEWLARRRAVIEAARQRLGRKRPRTKKEGQ